MLPGKNKFAVVMQARGLLGWRANGPPRLDRFMEEDGV